MSYVHTNNSDFVFTDKFMQLDLQIPSQRIYGLGERSREFSLEPGTWTMWANGRNESYDDGTGGKQTYGVHPFALVQTQSKTEWMGIFFRNANAQSPVITNKANKKSEDYDILRERCKPISKKLKDITNAKKPHQKVDEYSELGNNGTLSDEQTVQTDGAEVEKMPTRASD